MKWPQSLTLIRHGQSTYNALRAKKEADPDYLAFKKAFSANYRSEITRRLALEMQERYALGVGDYETSLTVEGKRQARRTGEKMKVSNAPFPDIILFSPYLRVVQTLEEVREGWPELKDVKAVPDDRIREMEHGLSLLYNDWRIFEALHPGQKELRKLLGPYWYRYPQGESVSDVRDRNRDVISMAIREHSGKHLMMFTHHLTILSTRANLERLTPEQFTYLDEHEKPVNCGVTLYKGNPNAGRNGRMELVFYNLKLWERFS